MQLVLHRAAYPAGRRPGPCIVRLSSQRPCHVLLAVTFPVGMAFYN